VIDHENLPEKSKLGGGDQVLMTQIGTTKTDALWWITDAISNWTLTMDIDEVATQLFEAAVQENLITFEGDGYYLNETRWHDETLIELAEKHRLG
jgi:hypothetical protein